MSKILRKPVIRRISKSKTKTFAPDNIVEFEDPSNKYRAVLLNKLFSGKSIENKRMDTKLFHYLKEKNVILAGGFLTSIFGNNDDFNDVDLFFKTEKDANAFFSKTLFKKNPVIKTQNAETFQYHDKVVQVIKRPDLNGSAKEILSRFDFTINQVAYDFATRKFYMGKEFFIDLAAKRLTYNVHAKNPISSLKRIVKYVKRGYSIDTQEILKLAIAVKNCKFETAKDIAYQLSAVSSALVLDDDMAEALSKCTKPEEMQALMDSCVLEDMDDSATINIANKEKELEEEEKRVIVGFVRTEMEELYPAGYPNPVRESRAITNNRWDRTIEGAIRGISQAPNASPDAVPNGTSLPTNLPDDNGDRSDDIPF